ncbi:hypothetical protein [Marilutibacter alkalisoli]|uniref:Uncharacterized protein n=1 Tax=Marilutibacter alkalisoli TaxID=2591633 RepID=A0A514BUK3_9GAMM|nr:hypothetical protein [Lysobacter alkalisoli]QDH71042.1 hypothetical protein FKV23_13820 [Lysobacter alkalisoli]
MSRPTLAQDHSKPICQVGDRPPDRAAGPRETLSRLVALINPKVRIAAGFQKLWFFQDDILTLDYRSSEGIRYAFDFRVTERGVSVAIVGRDDSSRHSIRKRCGAFGKLIDSNRRIELKWWRHSTPIDTIAIDAVGHLQRANTAMSTPSPWAPPRSIPSYWWIIAETSAI